MEAFGKNAVTNDKIIFPAAKDLYDFLKAKERAGDFDWIELKKKAKGNKAKKYGMRIQKNHLKWIPRPGEIGCVMRGDIKEYNAMPGISTWHRFVAVDDETPEGVLYVSENSCFCFVSFCFLF